MKPNPRTLRRQTSIVKLLAISVFLLPSGLAQQKSGGESEVQSVVQTVAHLLPTLRRSLTMDTS